MFPFVFSQRINNQRVGSLVSLVDVSISNGFDCRDLQLFTKYRL